MHRAATQTWPYFNIQKAYQGLSRRSENVEEVCKCPMRYPIMWMINVSICMRRWRKWVIAQKRRYSPENVRITRKTETLKRSEEERIERRKWVGGSYMGKNNLHTWKSRRNHEDEEGKTRREFEENWNERRLGLLSGDFRSRPLSTQVRYVESEFEQWGVLTEWRFPSSICVLRTSEEEAIVKTWEEARKSESSAH